MKNLVIFLIKKEKGLEPINQSSPSIYLLIHVQNPGSQDIGGL